ncbi:MAG: LCP family protein [Oscillospiraceae bacterium]|nr:LCP family protein [Oscillospiraceae bacterium]
MSVIKNFIITFCVAGLMFGGIAWLIVSYAVENIVPGFGDGPDSNNSSNTNNTSNNYNPESENNGQTEENSDDIIIIGNTFTVLIIGTDYQPAIFKDYNLSEANKSETGFPAKEREETADSIILIQFNPTTKKIIFSSIPSNMIVQVDGVDIQLGSLYKNKNIKFLSDKVTAVTGLKINYYAAISIENFQKIVDTIGEITYDVPIDMSYEDKTEGYKINLKKGTQSLNGDKLLQLLRYRSYANGNVTRMTVALGVAKTILAKLASPDNIGNAVSIYSKCVQYIDTNFNEAALTENIETIFAYSKFEIVDVTYPGESKSSGSGEYFTPNITEALNRYRIYK